MNPIVIAMTTRTNAAITADNEPIQGWVLRYSDGTSLTSDDVSKALWVARTSKNQKAVKEAKHVLWSYIDDIEGRVEAKGALEGIAVCLIPWIRPLAPRSLADDVIAGHKTLKEACEEAEK